jgi:hypothetical protein
MTRLNDVLDLFAPYHTEIDNSKIEGYGCKLAPCLSAEITSKRATEYVIKYDGRVRRVYNFEQESGTSRMYLRTDGGHFMRFLTEEAVTMLTYGEPHYHELTYVAQGVRVAA